MFGGNNPDNLQGQSGNDMLAGGNGLDILQGGGGNDSLDGGDRDDLITKGGGQDLAIGGPGDDILNANDDLSDRAVCGEGLDVAIIDAERGAYILKDCRRH